MSTTSQKGQSQQHILNGSGMNPEHRGNESKTSNRLAVICCVSRKLVIGVTLLGQTQGFITRLLTLKP